MTQVFSVAIEPSWEKWEKVYYSCGKAVGWKMAARGKNSLNLLNQKIEVETILRPKRADV